jgi:HPt (histidine-containing phosphotransfer) domain-containing protein
MEVSGKASDVANQGAVGSCNLRNTLDRLGGDEELMHALIHVFLEDGPALVSRIRIGRDSGNAQAIHHAAHSLRGLASNFDANHVITPAFKLERMAAVGRIDPTVDATLVELDHAVSELATDLAAKL